MWQQGESAIVGHEFYSVTRKEFQRAHVWDKFNCSGKIDWAEGQ